MPIDPLQLQLAHVPLNRPNAPDSFLGGAALQRCDTCPSNPTGLYPPRRSNAEPQLPDPSASHNPAPLPGPHTHMAHDSPPESFRRSCRAEGALSLSTPESSPPTDCHSLLAP